MHDLLPAWPLLSAFLVASLILAVTPGPGVFYIVTRSIAQGRRCGLASVAGVALGNLGNAIGASLGLAVLVAMSSIAFTVVKYAGALYLVYLGVRAIHARRPSGDIPLTRSGPLRQVFRDGFVVALLNPKTALFFTAFLPQFMRIDAAPLSRFRSRSPWSLVCHVAAGAVAPALVRARGIRALGRYLTGGAFFGLALFTALAEKRGVS